MTKYICIITILVLNFKSFSQNSYDIDQRQGKLFFSIGTEYLITPIHSSTDFSYESASTNMDKQNSGVAFFYDFNYFTTKNLSLGFTNTIKYGLNSNAFNQISEDFGFQSAENRIIFGYHFYLDYHFKVFKDSELFVRLGKSLVNRGTNNISKTTFFDDNGDVLFAVISEFDFSYSPWNFAIGYKKKKISVAAGVYSSSNTNYFRETTPFIVPYIQFKYNLGKL